MNKNNALLVFIKNPELGKVKTRLKPEFSDEDCVKIYKAMVNDLVKNICTEEYYDVAFFYTPSNSKAPLQNWLGYAHRFVPQSRGDLGTRMSAALHWAFENNYHKAVLIGSDIPTLDQKLVLKAFEKLNNSEVVLGPSDDGGYYLVGTREPQPQIFKNIHWSSEIVFSETLERLEENDLTVSVLEKRSDIDTYLDALNLFSFLNFSQNGYLLLMPETYKTLNKLMKSNKGKKNG